MKKRFRWLVEFSNERDQKHQCDADSAQMRNEVVEHREILASRS
jgi:hypothetical protein